MLKELSIKNVILIEDAKIQFEKGFNVISGETGSGKSAVMEALQLALGARSDTSLIRQGAEKAVIEAVFDISSLTAIQSFLNEKGIDGDDDTLLILKRELTSTGKSRSFVNHQNIQLSLLRQIGDLLIELVSQHANHKLFHTDHHRFLLDLYGQHKLELKEYQQCYQKVTELKAKWQSLKESLPKSTREIETCEREIKEIEDADLKESEEENLFQEHQLLASAEERQTLATTLEELLGSEKGVLSLLARSKPFYLSIADKDASLKDELSLFPQVLLEVDELVHSLRRYQSHLDSEPKRFEYLENRLSLITKLKRKYGSTLEEIQTHLSHQKQQLNSLSNLEQWMEETSIEMEKSQKELAKTAEKLTKVRQKTASLLTKKMTQELMSLNMKHAEFYIEITPQDYALNGSEQIEFYLSSNAGQKRIPLKDGVSGGELARVLLALHLLLAGKEGLGTLIFDEIDANIGGTTAKVIGEKLSALGENLQVLCITHFPQVAICAKHHLQISKSTEKGRTFTQVARLNLKNRDLELARMSGNLLD